jgi:hypothetical protein
MGAWGVGMKSNDTALDYIGKYQDFDKKGLPINAKGLAIVKGKTSLLKVLQKVLGYGTHAKKQLPPDAYKDMGVLGLAEFFLDNGANLKEARSCILAAIERQSKNKELQTWGQRAGDGGAREQALQRFRDRVNGKVVDAGAVAKDNEGLLSKMGRVLE